jgi:putative ABC transport system ATP-binding protein
VTLYYAPVHVSLRDVSYDYSATDEAAPVHVLDGVSLDIEEGEFVVLMGPSGSGKSTLLNLIGAIDRPTRGSVLLDGRDTAQMTESALTLLRRSAIGFVFQFFNLIPTLSVSENVGFPLALAGTSKAETTERVREVLARVGLTHRATHYPNELSGGEMQRVAIGRAIIHRPSLILADEPTGNLDSRNGTAILDLIREVHDSYRPTVVMATHSDRAASYGGRIVRVEDGRAGR